jgi:PPOX class probable F420-dependent enzyme
MRMSNEKLAQFTNQKYLNLESYRKNGMPVATPVWFAEDDGVFYVYSLANAGKVKRIRNNPRVRVMPCDVRGKPKGAWVDAEARIADAATDARGHQLLNKKYGMLKRIGDVFSKLRKRERAVITIRVN